jgi:serine/threonine-protein kinase
LAVIAGQEEQLAARIVRSPIKEQLLAALDAWASTAWHSRQTELQDRLLQIARHADPDPWKDQVRNPTLWRNQQALQTLAGKVRADKKSLARLSPQMLEIFGYLLQGKGEAEAWLREAHTLHPADFWLNIRLSEVLCNTRPAQAEGFCRAALAVRSHSHAAWHNLGVALHRQKDLARAIVAYKKSLDYDPRSPPTWYHLGLALNDQHDLVGAIANYKKSLELDPRNPAVWSSLGKALADKKDVSGAVAALQEAVHLDPKQLNPRLMLGLAWYKDGNFAEAAAAYQAALRLLPRQHASYSLLQAQVRHCQKLVTQEKRLAAILKGEKSTPAERLALIDFCSRYQKRFTDVVRLYAAVFAEEPALAEDLDKGRRYRAACAAALAAAGKGKVADQLVDADRARLRRQALSWLQADLQAWRQLQQSSPLSAVTARNQLERWLSDPDLATVRDAKALARLPTEERQAWQQLWAEVEKLCK